MLETVVIVAVEHFLEGVHITIVTFVIRSISRVNMRFDCFGENHFKVHKHGILIYMLTTPSLSSNEVFYSLRVALETRSLTTLHTKEQFARTEIAKADTALEM